MRLAGVVLSAVVANPPDLFESLVIRWFEELAVARECAVVRESWLTARGAGQVYTAGISVSNGLLCGPSHGSSSLNLAYSSRSPRNGRMATRQLSPGRPWLSEIAAFGKEPTSS